MEWFYQKIKQIERIKIENINNKSLPPGGFWERGLH